MKMKMKMKMKMMVARLMWEDDEDEDEDDGCQNDVGRSSGKNIESGVGRSSSSSS